MLFGNYLINLAVHYNRQVLLHALHNSKLIHIATYMYVLVVCQSVKHAGFNNSLIESAWLSIFQID